MKKIRITIEKTSDSYSAYAENVEGIYAAGDSVVETKQSVADSIALYKKYNKENLPKILQGDYEIIYKFDTQILLNYYKGIFTNASLERLTGIKQKQIQHYATGLKKPRASQKIKIQNSLHQLASELMSIEL
jgi:predicted RNase H-like HicB family nuclease